MGTMISSNPSTKTDNAWVWPGLYLVAMGIGFWLLRFSQPANNWWALFIFLPGFGLLWLSWLLAQRRDHFGIPETLVAFSGLITLATSLVFLLGLDMGNFWPVYPVLTGLMLFVLGILMPGKPSKTISITLRGWSLSIGLATLYQGCGFFSITLQFLPVDLYFPHWWAFSLLHTALGGALTSLVLYNRAARFTPLATASLTAAAICAGIGLIPLLSLSWHLTTPVILMTTGLGTLLSRTKKA